MIEEDKVEKSFMQSFEHRLEGEGGDSDEGDLVSHYMMHFRGNGTTQVCMTFLRESWCDTGKDEGAWLDPPKLMIDRAHTASSGSIVRKWALSAFTKFSHKRLLHDGIKLHTSVLGVASLS